MLKILKKLMFLLDSNTKRKGIYLLGMILIMGLLEMIGVASIMPFIGVLTNPDIIYTNFFLKKIYDESAILGVTDEYQFLFLLGIFVFLVLIISITFKAITNYKQIRFTKFCEFTIGKKLVETYLNHPYSWFLNRHSADLGKSILSEANFVIDHGINPIINLIAQGVVVISITSLLVLVDYKVALTVCLLFLTLYGIIYKYVRSTLFRLGKERVEENKKRFTSVNETFSSIKEIKVAGLEQNEVNKFSDAAFNLARIESYSLVLSHLPRFAIEAISFGGMVLGILIFMRVNSDFINILPLIGLYAIAGYRLIPALQSIYASITYIRSVTTSLDMLYNDLSNIKIPNYNLNKKNEKKIFLFKNNIQLKKINYTYPKSKRLILENINLTIPVKSKIGLIGTTGSGKSTLVDIILGLLEVNNGIFKVDEITIHEGNCRNWQRIIGYVPQTIYLSDDTISSNIAFGLDKNNINQKYVEHVSKIAQLHDFVDGELPEKYETLVGERGVRLSGGQRQRIGIARALYHKPKLLILDEATSALDNKTEKDVIEAINKIDKEITTISIAHRLSSLENCDSIYEIKDGKLIKQSN